MRLNKDTIKAAANARADHLFIMAWGEPVARGAKEWRPKSDDSFSMCMVGPNRGAWYWHRQGRGGDILNFVACQLLGEPISRQNFSRVLEETAALLGIPAGELRGKADQRQKSDNLASHEAAEQAQQEDVRRKGELVLEALSRSKNIAGTPAQAYLESRGLGAPIAHENIRWLPAGAVPGLPLANVGSIAFFATDVSGRVAGMQRVLLDSAGRKARGEKKSKYFAGRKSGNFLRFPASKSDGPLFVAEGPESALTVSLATGHETWAAVDAAGFLHLAPPVGRTLILCPDQDAKDSHADRAFEKAVQKLRDVGLEPIILRCPEPVGSKSDFNDTLKRLGLDDVREFISTKLRDGEAPLRNKAGRFAGAGPKLRNDASLTPPAQGLHSVADGRQAVAAEISAFFADFESRGVHAQSLLLKADQGLGKSHAVMAELARLWLAGLKNDVVLYVPTYNLADEYVEALELMGVPAFVMRGRSAIPPGTDRMTCDQADLARTIGKAGASVTQQLCRSCPFRDDCAYERQWRELPAGPVIRIHMTSVLPHQGHDRGRPAGLRIIDESFFGALVERESKSWKQLERSSSALSMSERAALSSALQALGAAGETLGQVDMSALASIDLGTIADKLARHVRGPLRAGGIDGDLGAGWEKELRRRGLLRFLASVFRTLADCRARGVAISQRVYFSGQVAERRLHLDRSNELPNDAPILILDAGGSELFLKRFVPGAPMVSIRAMRNAEVIQVKDQVFGKKMLQSELIHRQVGALIRSEVLRETPLGERAKVLVVASKSVVAQLWSRFGSAGAEARSVTYGATFLGAEWIWFGPGSLGINRYRDYDTVIVLGREELPDHELEGMARAVFADRGHFLDFSDCGDKRRSMVDLPGEMADGSTFEISAPARRDPYVRDMQMQVRELNTLQCIERLRLVNAVEPKRVIVASKLPIPGLPVTRHVAWDELLPSRADQAINEARLGRGILRVSAQGLAEDAPGTFATPKAAEIWLSREGGREALIPTQAGNSYMGSERGNPRLIKLRKSGVAGRWSTALVLRGGDIDCLLEEAFPDPMRWEPLGVIAERVASGATISSEQEGRASAPEAEHLITPHAAVESNACRTRSPVVPIAQEFTSGRISVGAKHSRWPGAPHALPCAGARGPPGCADIPRPYVSLSRDQKGAIP